MNVMEYIVALERRIAALEANRGASLRYCEVTGVDTNGSARVKLLDGDKMVSHPLRTLQRRTRKDKDQCFPDIGEHVACLFSGQGLESGVVLGAMYSETNKAPEQDAHYGYYRYEDGTTIYYDRAAHKYVADVKGDIDVTCEKSATVQAKKNITVRTEQTLILEGRAGVRMRGPTIIFEGIDGGACDAAINADLKIRGLVDHRGNLIQSGNQDVNGDIRASGLVQGNPVEGCRH